MKHLATLVLAIFLLSVTATAGPQDSLVGVSARKQFEFRMQGRQITRPLNVRQAGVVVGKNLVLTASLGDKASNVRIYVPGTTNGLDGEIVDSDESFSLVKVPDLKTKPVVFTEVWAAEPGSTVTWHGILGGRLGEWSVVSKQATKDAILDDGRRIYSDPPFRGPVLTPGALVTDAQGKAVGMVILVQNEEGAAGGGGRGRRMRRPGGGTPFIRPVRTFAHFLTGTVMKRGVLGVEGETLDEQVAEALGLKGRKGILVTRVVPGSGAAKAGIEAQQVIVKIAGQETATAVAMKRALRGQAAGAKIAVTLLGVGVEGITERTVEVTLTAPEESTPEQRVRAQRFGFTAEPLTDAMRRDRGLPADTKGVSVRRVAPGGPAAIATPERLRRGDAILRVNETDVPSVAKLREALEKAKKSGEITLFVQRGTETRFIELEAEAPPAEPKK